MKLAWPALLVIVAGTLAMFAAMFAYSAYVHEPLIADLCSQSCAKLDLKAEVDYGYVSRSRMESCRCVRLATYNEPELIDAYFLVDVPALDWFLLVLLRLLPSALILFVFVLGIAKLVQRLGSLD